MKKYLFSAVISFLGLQSCIAGVTITGTRIIFPSNQKQIVVQLNNPDARPALIQAWLDDGNPKEIPKADKIPFILTPPISRLEANKGQMIRLVNKDTSRLAKDRETLYWFNILDVAPTDSSIPNKLNISVRSRIKLFYRPSNIRSKPSDFYSKLVFTYIKDEHVIEVSNPSPFYVNFQKLTVATQNKETELYTDPLMISPFGVTSFKVKLHVPKTTNYELINDFGGVNSFSAEIK